MKVEVKQGGGGWVVLLLVVLLIGSLFFGYKQHDKLKQEKINSELISNSFANSKDSLERITVKLNDDLKVQVAKTKTEV